MSSVKVDAVVKESASIGEGPVWEEADQTLLFVDIMGRNIHRYSPQTKQIQSVKTADTVGFAIPRQSGGYIAGVGRSIVALDWSTQLMTSLAEVDEDKTTRLNDGKADPTGRLFAGTMGLEESPGVFIKQKGSLFSVSPDLTVSKHLSPVDISNGLDWSEDRQTFFYIDSLSFTVDAFDYDIITGQLSNQRVVYKMQEEDAIPDGMTVDANGHLWVACFNGGRVINIDPATGVRLRTVLLPAAKTTSCCFGGPDYSDLYVTSASLGLQSELKQQPLAGATFKVAGLGVKGRPSHAFSG